MNLKLGLILLMMASFAVATNADANTKENAPHVAPTGRLYEMRIYYCEPGRLDALLKRFRDHTTRIFEKHGMTNVGYWLPIDNTDNKLVYVLSYPDLAARETAWKAFGSDPEWKKVATDSEKDGKIVKKVDKIFMHETDFSQAMQVKGSAPDRVFELRTYHTLPGKLPDLLARFRNHTVDLFKKHGMTNLNYWLPDEIDNRLIYMLAHDSQEAGKKSFDDFREDPKWVKARDESERNGKIVEKVESTFMKATDFSPIR